MPVMLPVHPRDCAVTAEPRFIMKIAMAKDLKEKDLVTRLFLTSYFRKIIRKRMLRVTSFGRTYLDFWIFEYRFLDFSLQNPDRQSTKNAKKTPHKTANY